MGLNPALLQALTSEGYHTPTPIQSQAIPDVMKGKDLLGIAQTGTGKTAAFALPILHRLAADRKAPVPRTTRALILSPTRELASQIADSFKVYGAHLGFRVAVIFGGVKYGGQERALQQGLDILVATPGRLLDHVQQKTLDLSTTEIFVLDEADQMLDLGFVKPIRQVVSRMTARRQNLFFSATMPTEIGKLAGELLKDPVKVQVTPQATTVERINQSVIIVEQGRKRALLSEMFADPAMTRCLVFTKTKHGADKVAAYLEAGGVEAGAIHGNKSQSQRERALEAFKKGKLRVLVATDIAARGIDVDGVSHVVNFELPFVPEAYVHRIGRTARAGADGSAVSFCAPDEMKLLRDIERVTRQKLKAGIAATTRPWRRWTPPSWLRASARRPPCRTTSVRAATDAAPAVAAATAIRTATACVPKAARVSPTAFAAAASPAPSRPTAPSRRVRPSIPWPANARPSHRWKATSR